VARFATTTRAAVRGTCRVTVGQDGRDARVTVGGDFPERGVPAREATVTELIAFWIAGRPPALSVSSDVIERRGSARTRPRSSPTAC
jgi:hypothetical protein